MLALPHALSLPPAAADRLPRPPRRPLGRGLLRRKQPQFLSGHQRGFRLRLRRRAPHVLHPGEALECFSGAPEQKNVGLCVAGQKTCNAEGSAFGPCEGEVLPTAETCANPADEDCDGLTDEEGPDCACAPGETKDCYSGPPATKGVGPCKAGTHVCKDDGTGFGPCKGEIKPVAETCTNSIDDDCDGQINESGTGCACSPGASVACYTGPAGTAGVGACHAGKAQCNAQGTALGPCVGDVVPSAEACLSAIDSDCDGLTNETTACSCTLGDVVACYTGPSGSSGVGVCHGGQQTCLGGSLGYGPCMGEVTPAANDDCATKADENCDGALNELCPCFVGDIMVCYTGPVSTLNVGACHAGTQVCQANGPSWGPCTGEVVPVTEVCGNLGDDDCDGVVDEKSWIETTADTHPPGPHSALVVDAAGGVHLLYHDTFFDHLVYAYKPPGGVFTRTTVDTHTTGPYPQLVVDAAGGVHALYLDTFFDHLDYAYKPAGGSFTETTVDTHTPGPHPALVVDATGGVHALYHDTFFDHLDYSYKSAGGVFAESIVDTHTPGDDPKLVVDVAGGVHALYHDTFFDHLDYAYKPAGGSFTETTVDTHTPGDHPRLVVDGSGGVHALYHDMFFDHLDYAYRCP
jgi:putative metal-binding protein